MWKGGSCFDLLRDARESHELQIEQCSRFEFRFEEQKNHLSLFFAIILPCVVLQFEGQRQQQQYLCCLFSFLFLFEIGRALRSKEFIHKRQKKEKKEKNGKLCWSQLNLLLLHKLEVVSFLWTVSWQRNLKFFVVPGNVLTTRFANEYI